MSSDLTPPIPAGYNTEDLTKGTCDPLKGDGGRKLY